MVWNDLKTVINVNCLTEVAMNKLKLIFEFEWVYWPFLVFRLAVSKAKINLDVPQGSVIGPLFITSE
jgi:hypothetical protein